MACATVSETEVFTRLWLNNEEKKFISLSIQTVESSFDLKEHVEAIPQVVSRPQPDNEFKKQEDEKVKAKKTIKFAKQSEVPSRKTISPAVVYPNVYVDDEFGVSMIEPAEPEKSDLSVLSLRTGSDASVPNKPPPPDDQELFTLPNRESYITQEWISRPVTKWFQFNSVETVHLSNELKTGMPSLPTMSKEKAIKQSFGYPDILNRVQLIEPGSLYEEELRTLTEFADTIAERLLNAEPGSSCDICGNPVVIPELEDSITCCAKYRELLQFATRFASSDILIRKTNNQFSRKAVDQRRKPQDNPKFSQLQSSAWFRKAITFVDKLS
ncbi:hypothetical protein Ciccas_012995 [Cichlidogyrus casuarinus]|uniref:Uncharacterized protein n=1 Tax=Cichlidogyrus casuarinus TaxID=1844966 RepID=A0ABD2PLV6_9PLAT